MVKVSELLSKQLICLDTATIEGTICNINFDSKLSVGKCLELFCEDDITPEKKFVPLKDVLSLSQDAAVVKNCDSIIYEWQNDEGGFNPINCVCYNCVGASLGVVRDIILDGAKVDKIVLSSREFTPKELVSYSDNLLIFNDTGKPIKIVKPKNKFPRASSSASAQLHANSASFVNLANANSPYLSSASAQNVLTATSKIEPDAQTLSVAPIFITPDSTKVLRCPQSAPSSENSYKFLLGKVLRSSITDTNGKILFAENTTVTAATISAARANGKLVQLALRAY